MKRFGRWLAGGTALAWCLSAVAASVEGEVQWLRRVELSTPVSGVVQQVHVQAGDRVETGDALVELDKRGLRAELKRVRADLERLQQAAAEAERELERAQELYDRTLLSQHDLDLAEIADTSAKARVREAEARLAQVRLDLEYSTVSAPFAGIVLARPVETGQTVITDLQAVPLVVLADPETMLARLNVDEQTVNRLQEGTEVTVRVDQDAFSGRIRYLGFEPVASAAEAPALYPVEVVFRPDRPLRVGRKVSVELP